MLRRFAPSEDLHLMIGFMLALKPKNLTGKEVSWLYSR